VDYALKYHLNAPKRRLIRNQYIVRMSLNFPS